MGGGGGGGRSLQEFFFCGLVAAHEFFFLICSLAQIFFLYLAHPPITFLIVGPLEGVLAVKLENDIAYL